jgi:hypothetical protein
MSRYDPIERSWRSQPDGSRQECIGLDRHEDVPGVRRGTV